MKMVTVVLLLGLLIGLQAIQLATAKPNIVLILTDDLGYGEVNNDPAYAFPVDPLSPGGGTPIPRPNPKHILNTPNLVRFSKQGLRAVMAYAPSSLCTPSRVGIMMGRIVGRNQLRGNSEVGELTDNSTLAITLRKAGYTTGYFGKWGLGQLQGGPWNHGFDEFSGQLMTLEAHTVFPKFVTRYKRKTDGVPSTSAAVTALRVPLTGNLNRNFNEMTCPRAVNSSCTYVNDVVRDAAFDFLQTAPQPFFLYWAPTYPHAAQYNPTDKPKTYVSAIKRLSRRPPYGDLNENTRGHAAQIESHFDGDIAALLDLLESNPTLDNNTLVVISSDNGPHNDERQHVSANLKYSPAYFGSAGGLRGIKRSMFEGGIRVPTLIRWKNHIPADKVTRVPFALYDLAATFASAAGVSSNAETSWNMLPVWKSNNETLAPQRTWLYFEICNTNSLGQTVGCSMAVTNITEWRSGDVWKLVNQANKKPLLFNLRADPTESKPVNDIGRTQALLTLLSNLRTPPN